MRKDANEEARRVGEAHDNVAVRTFEAVATVLLDAVYLAKRAMNSREFYRKRCEELEERREVVEVDQIVRSILPRFIRDGEDAYDFATYKLKQHVLSLDDHELADPKKVVAAWVAQFVKTHPTFARKKARTSTTTPGPSAPRSAPSPASNAQPSSPETTPASTATDLRSSTAPRKSRAVNAARAPRESRRASHGRSGGEG